MKGEISLVVEQEVVKEVKVRFDGVQEPLAHSKALSLVSINKFDVLPGFCRDEDSTLPEESSVQRTRSDKSSWARLRMDFLGFLLTESLTAATFSGVLAVIFPHCLVL